MNAQELNQKLCENSESAVKYLFPMAKVKRGKAYVGSLGGEPGESLVIELEGAKNGFWSDFAGDTKARSLVSLWIQAKGVDAAAGLKQIQEYLGIKDVHYESRFYGRKQEFKKPCDTSKVKKLKPGSALDYLTNVRKISQAVLEKYKVCESEDRKSIIFPCLREDGKTCDMFKVLKVERGPKGEKEFSCSKDPIKALFGKPAIADKETELYLCEAEIDALSMSEMGYSAVSVPFGAKWEGADGRDPNDEWIQNDFDWLSRFERIYLCFDSDEPGKKAAQSIAKRLGLERCFFVEMPEECKDTNDVLVKEKQYEFFEKIEGSQTIDPDGLCDISQFIEGAWEILNPTDGIKAGVPFINDMKWNIRRGEVTLWTGISAHGKSVALAFTSVHLASHGEKICMASFEMPCDQMLSILVRQAAGKIPKIREEYDQVCAWIKERFWLINQEKSPNWKVILDIFLYAYKRYGTRQFILDSFMCFGIRQDDYTAQQQFIQAIVDFAKKYLVHIHIVAHSRKGENEDIAPGKMDVKGPQELTALVHNGITVFRNKSKEDSKEDAKEKGDHKKIQEIERKPDGCLRMWKQRITGFEPRSNFFFHYPSQQFLEYSEKSDYQWEPKCFYKPKETIENA